MHRIELVIVIFLSVKFLDSSIASIYCTDREPPADDSILTNRSHYTDDAKAKIIRIFQETHTGEKGHEKRMKERWDEIHGRDMPQTGHNLLRQAMRWIKKGYAEELLTEQERRTLKPFTIKKQMKWTPEMKASVVKFYHETDPNKWNQSKRIKELWDREYPDHSEIRATYLMKRAGNLLKNQGEDINMKRIKLKEGEKEDLLRYYHQSLEHEGEELKIMRELFIEKYPQYAKLRSSNLRDRVHLILQNNPEIEKKILGRVSTFDTVHSSREPGETSGLKWGESTSIPATDPDLFPGALGFGETSSLDVGQSHQSVPGHPGVVGTIQQTINYENAWEKDTTLRLGMSDHVIHSTQRPSKKSLRKSTEGKEPVFD